MRLLLAFLALLAGSQAGAQIAFRDAASAGVASLALAAPAFGAAGAAAAAGNGSVTPALPAGTVAGNLLIAQVVAKDNCAVSMAGWNTLFSQAPEANFQSLIFWKIAAGGDATTVTHPGGACSGIIAQITRYTNVDTNSPFETLPLAAANAQYTASSLTITSGTQTTQSANALLVFSGHMADNFAAASSPGAGWTQRSLGAAGAGGGMGLVLFTRTEATAGAKGPVSTTVSGASVAASPNHGVLFSLRPPGLTINKPPATVTGDVMVATVAVRPSGSILVIPAGWTLVRQTTTVGADTERVETYYKVATAAEPASYTWTVSSVASTGAVGGIIAFSEVDTLSLSPVNVEAGATTASSFTHATPAVSTTVPNTMVVTAHAFPSVTSNWTPPAGMTEGVDAASQARPSTSGISLSMNYATQAGAASTGTKSAVAASPGSDAGPGAAHILALRPMHRHYGITVTTSDVATCEPVTVRIEGHTNGHGGAAPPAGTTLTINTSSGSGVWQSPAVTGGGTWTPSGANNGSATYTWTGTEYVLEIRLRHNTVQTLNVNLADTNTRAESVTEDPSLNFRDSVLRVTANGSSVASVPTQIAGKRSDAGFGAQTLYVQAVATSPATGACTTLFQNQQVSVDFAVVCNNPTACSAVAGTSFEILDRTNAFVSVAKNDGPGSPAAYTGVSLQFSNDANAMAPLVARHGDAGQMTLHMRAALPAPPASTFIIGSSNAFVVRPFGFAFRGDNATLAIQHGTTHTSALFVDTNTSATASAGDNFTMTVGAYKWAAAHDGNNDGIPDAGTNITGNGLTPSFAAITTLAVAANLPGTDPGTIARASGGSDIAAGEWSNGAARITNWRYSEVGNVRLTATSNDYLGASDADITGNSGLDGTGDAGGYIGRFRPKHFAMSGATSLANRAVLGCGGTFSYLDEGLDLTFTLVAQNAQNAVTQNYTGSYARLDLTTGGTNNPTIAFGIGARSGATNLTGRVSSVYAGSAPSWSSGSLAVSGAGRVRAAIARATPDNPDGPFPATAFGIAPTDADGVAMATLDLDVDSNASADHKDLGVSTELRFGRLRCQNALGPAGVQVPIPLTVQHYTAGSFATNTSDSCTPITAATIAPRAPPVGTVNLASTLPVTVASGAANIRFDGASPQSIADVTFTVPSYLKGNWASADADSNANTSYDDNPVCSVGFGLFGAQPRQFIYQRENY